MSNFKSGSGNLDFGESDEGEESESTVESSESTDEESEGTESETTDQAPPDGSDRQSPDRDNTSDRSESDRGSGDESTVTGSSGEQYPYFVRRSNVGDERDTRLEIHVRDKVADQEAEFRNDLAEYLGTNEVAKTDAREFALLAAFRHPERVAELMQDEGFGTLD